MRVNFDKHILQNIVSIGAIAHACANKRPQLRMKCFPHFCGAHNLVRGHLQRLIGSARAAAVCQTRLRLHGWFFGLQ